MKILKLLVLIIIATTAITAKAQTATQGLRVGDKAPDFTLTNQEGNEVNLYKQLEKGPVILNWYRGGWCPYCNLELKEFAKKAAEINQLGAIFLAISPELQDKSIATIKKNSLPFNVVTDVNNIVARKYDLVFKLDNETATRYENNFGLSKHNGNNDAELPIPATYIIDQSGVIRYAFVNPNYKKRANIEDVLMQLTQITF